MMKPQGQVATMTTTSAATPSKYTISFLMVAGLQKIGKKLDHPHSKEARGPSTTDQTTTTREGACQAEDAVMTEAHSSLRIASTMTMTPIITQKIVQYSSNPTNLHIACTMTTTPTIAQKTAQYSSNPRGRWSKTPTSLHNNPHPEN
jgi:hypothetical protein